MHIGKFHPSSETYCHSPLCDCILINIKIQRPTYLNDVFRLNAQYEIEKSILNGTCYGNDPAIDVKSRISTIHCIISIRN